MDSNLQHTKTTCLEGARDCLAFQHSTSRDLQVHVSRCQKLLWSLRRVRTYSFEGDVEAAEGEVQAMLEELKLAKANARQTKQQQGGIQSTGSLVIRVNLLKSGPKGGRPFKDI